MLFSRELEAPQDRKEERGIKVHSVIHANEGVPCDVQFTSAATNDSFMLAPSHYRHNEIVALDRAYLNYAKFEELTERGVVYVTKMKKNLNDSFMLAPSHYRHNEIVALDRAYLNYAKFEELTERGVVYVTKMKKNLSYEVLVDCMHQNPQGLI